MWVSCVSSVAVPVWESSEITTTRDWGCTVGEEPLSKMLIAPSGSSRGSCCQAVRVAAAPPKLECLPPSCQRIRPVAGSRS